jgi:integrase
MTFGEFWVMWFDEYVVPNNSHSEQQTKRSVFNNHLQSVFGRVPLAEIDRTMIERFKGSLLKKGLKKKTINSILSHLRCCLGEAEERELIERVPRIRAMKTQDPEWTYLTSEELNRLLLASDEVERGEMVRLAARTGMRLGELLGLRWKDVDFDARVVRIANTVVRGKEKGTKSSRTRYVPLASDLVERLRALPVAEKYVFSNSEGAPLTAWQAYTILKRCRRKAGVRDVKWHALRHTFASLLAQAGVPLFTIQKFLGHSTVMMTERYAHFSSALDHNAVEMLTRATTGHGTIQAPKPETTGCHPMVSLG